MTDSRQIDTFVALSRINLSRIECGKASITIRTLHRIAQALGVRLADLLEGLD